MTNAIELQGTVERTVKDNAQVFRQEYERLNWKQQRIEQKAFCEYHAITPGGFRARLAGTVRVSDTELFWWQSVISKYFTRPSQADVTPI